MTPPSPLLQDLQDALELCRAGQLEEAGLAYARLAGSPTLPAASAEALAGLGRLAGELGHAAASAAWLERAAAADPGAARLVELGDARLAARDFPGACNAFRDGLGLDGTAVHGWIGLGDALRELTRWEPAAKAYAEACARDPRSLDARVGLALALVSDDRGEPGMVAVRAALEIEPDAPAALRVLALALLRARRVEEAERVCLVALGRRPDYPEGRAALALVRMMQGRLEEADDLFVAAIEAKPTQAEAIGNHAALLARMGRDAEAARQAARAGKLKPFLPAPFNLLGTLLRRTGQLGEAAAVFRHVLDLVPGHLEARANLVDTLRLSGDAPAALAVCRAGLENHPDDVGLLANLGAVLQEQGDADGAFAAYGRALDLQPGLPEVVNNIARLHQAAGRHDEALAHLRRAAEARPQDGEIARNLSAVLLDTIAATGAAAGAGPAAALLAEAEATARVAAAATKDAAAYRQLAHVLDRQGRLDEAEAALGEAIRLAPGDVEGWFQAGALLLRAGERMRAVPYCRQAVRLAPASAAVGARAWAMFAQSLHGLRLTVADEALRADLLAAIAHPAAENAYLLEAVASVVALNPAMGRLQAAVASADPVGAVTALLRGAPMAALAEDRLLCALLETTIVTDPALERSLTVLRRALLSFAGEDGVSVLDNPVWLPLLYALADQCFLNEYTFAETEEESARAAGLAAALSGAIGRKEVPIPSRIALLAAYRPLVHWDGAPKLLIHNNWPDRMAALLACHVREPLAEAELAAGLERLTPIDDAVSRAVRAQYEENPYPRWRHAGLLEAPVPVPRVIRAILPHVTLEAAPGWTAPELLVAGCGTGRESVWAANQMAGARVLAVDLSLPSLSYAKRQTEALGIASVTYAQADILGLATGLATLGRRFDVIQSVGVLHHLADPLAGLRILTGLLQPHGVMKIGLYSARARGTVTAAQAFIAERGYGSSSADIRRFRQDVQALPADHPAAGIAWSPDFYNISACRDLLFHVQEHRTSLPEIAGWLEGLGLEFLGFQFEDPAVPRRYRERFPEDPDTTALALWDRFEAENPHTFAGLYQFWVRFRR